MKAIIGSSLVFAAVLLAGCTVMETVLPETTKTIQEIRGTRPSTPDKPTQLAATTLRIRDNNSVGFIAGAGPQRFFLTTKDAQYAIAYSVMDGERNMYVNALDTQGISADGGAVMKDGRTYPLADDRVRLCYHTLGETLCNRGIDSYTAEATIVTYENGEVSLVEPASEQAVVYYLTRPDVIITDPNAVKQELTAAIGPYLAKMEAKEAEERKAKQAAEEARREKYQSERRARIAAREQLAATMRKSIGIGTETNCGPVFEVRKPMIGVQTAVGMQFIQIDRLYAPGAGCVFSGNQYVGPEPIY